MVTPEEGRALAKQKQEQSERYREWYSKNKEMLLERRRMRYQHDPEYRATIARSRRKRALIQKELRRLNPKPRDGKHEFKVESPSGLGQVVMTFYQVGPVCKELGISKSVLNEWERRGIIPQAIYRTGGGWRLRTECELEAIKASLLAARIARAKDGCVNLYHSDHEGLRQEVARRYELMEVGILKDMFQQPTY